MAMNYRKNLSVLAFLSFSFGLMAVGGCTKINESWTYVAVPDALVTRPFEPGSQGPLVLETIDPNAKPPEKPDPTKAVDKLTTEQIGRLDSIMGEKLKKKATLITDMEEYRRQGLASSHNKFMEAQRSLDDVTMDIEDYERSFKAQKKESISIINGHQTSAPVKKPMPQTVLVASVRREVGTYAASRGRTMIIFLDGKPTPGEYWLNEENSVMINFSSITAPSRSRGALQGSIRIVRADEKSVVADIAIHDKTSEDYAEFNEKPFDPLQWQMPWNMIGRQEFKITSSEDPALKNAQVVWNKAGTDKN